MRGGIRVSDGSGGVCLDLYSIVEGNPASHRQQKEPEMDNTIKNETHDAHLDATTSGRLMRNIDRLEKAAQCDDVWGIIPTMQDVLRMLGLNYRPADDAIWQTKDCIHIRKSACALVGYIHDIAVNLPKALETRQDVVEALRKLSTVIRYLRAKSEGERITKDQTLNTSLEEVSMGQIFSMRRWLRQTANGDNTGGVIPELLCRVEEIGLTLPHDTWLLCTVYANGGSQLVATIMLEMVESISHELMGFAGYLDGVDAVEYAMSKVRDSLAEEAAEA